MVAAIRMDSYKMFLSTIKCDTVLVALVMDASLYGCQMHVNVMIRYLPIKFTEDVHVIGK